MGLIIGLQVPFHQVSKYINMILISSRHLLLSPTL